MKECCLRLRYKTRRLSVFRHSPLLPPQRRESLTRNRISKYVSSAMRGHIKSVDKTVPQILMHERLGHSEKPPIIRERIVQLFGDVSRIELFARQRTAGWGAIGDWDDDIIHIGTKYYLNLEMPKCRTCPINKLYEGYQNQPELIEKYRT